MSANASVNNLISVCTAFVITALVLTNVAFVSGQSKTTDAAALEMKADTLLGQQDYAGAITLFNKIISSSKNVKDEIYYKRAFALYNAGDYDKALADVNRYLTNHNEFQARALRAYIYQELGDFKKELAEITEIMKTNDSPDMVRWRVSIAMEAGEYELAQQDIKRLLALNSNPELESYLALTYYYQENMDSAMSVVNKIIKDKPDFVQAYLYAGSFMLEEENYNLALEYINSGLGHDPANPSLMFYKGVALAELKNLDEGCRCLYKAFSSGVDDAADYLKEYCYSSE